VAEASIPVPPRAGARGAPKRLLALRSDAHLVSRVRDGDEGAFEVLYERHVAGVLSFCRHMLGTREEAEDVVSHSFAAAHGGLLRHEREIDFKPWLYAIARNRSLSVLRARPELGDPEAEVSTAGLGDDVRRRADLRTLVADIQDLPPDQREALVLTELEDLSHAEVAEVLGRPVASVKGLVHRARSGLIERRDARATPCEEIRAELATARKGSLRKGKLRHHLKECVGCSAYLEDVRRQRRMLALLLPVVPSVGLKRSVLATCGLGSAGGAGAGTAGLIAGGGPLATGAVAKVAIAGALGAAALGGGVAVKDFTDDGKAPPAGQVDQKRPAPGTRAGSPAGSSRRSSTTPGVGRQPGGGPATSRGNASTGRRGAGRTKSSFSRGQGKSRRASKPSRLRSPRRSGATPAVPARGPSSAPPRRTDATSPVAPEKAPLTKLRQRATAPKVRSEKPLLGE